MTNEKSKIDKSKFVFVNNDNKGINDVALTTKQVGYYKDVFIRFKKNKASIVSFIIILVILFFTLVGPVLKKVEPLSKSNELSMTYLTPKIPILEKIGIFDGSKTVETNSKFINSLPEGIVIKIVEEGIGSDGNKTKAKVDYYKYVNYVSSYYTEDGVLATRNLTLDEYNLALERNAVIDLIEIKKMESDTLYVARIDAFRFALNQSPENTYFWFGTGADGKDLFTTMWNAARISILLATIVSVVNLIIGTIIGAFIGYYGGWLDILFDRIIDILGSLPFIALLTIIIVKFGSSVFVVFIAFVATGWLGSYGRTRMQFYRFKTREYVLAARTLGARDRRIMFKHILPNGMGLMITAFSLSIPSFMFGEATYSYLGIIKYKGTVSIGELLSNGQAMMTNHPHLLLFPAIFISVLMLSFNLLGNGLRDAFNPSLRGVE
ncbi:MAG: ABC transporter permease [Acholeplasma sp.]|nr:ABC transporter permease [Acholeplasma sp.]